jgi:GNAT superfamily N-acetyltransferase
MCEEEEKVLRTFVATAKKSMGPGYRAHVEIGPLCAYLRWTFQHYEYQERRTTIDVASISVDEAFQRQGRGTRFFQAVEKIAREENRYVFVENVMSEILQNFLEKRGYTKEDRPVTPCYWLKH